MKAKRKKKSVEGNGAANRWQRRWAKLTEERDELRAEVDSLRKERDEYLKALYALTYEDTDFDKKKLLAQVGQSPTLEELIAELEAQDSDGSAQGRAAFEMSNLRMPKRKRLSK